MCLRSNIGENYLNAQIALSLWASALKELRGSLLGFLETQIMFFNRLKRWDERRWGMEISDNIEKYILSIPELAYLHPTS